MPGSLAEPAAPYQSVSLWFKTSTPDGVLFSQSADPVTSGTTTNPYARCCTSARRQAPRRLRRHRHPADVAAPVNDGSWHNVVLTSRGTQEVMYIDGAQVASCPARSAFVGAYIYLGAGFLGGSYPDEPHCKLDHGTARGLYGRMSDAATWDRQLTAAEVSSLYATGTHSGVAAHQDHPPVGKGLRAGVLRPGDLPGDAGDRCQRRVVDGGPPRPTPGRAASTWRRCWAASRSDYWRLADTGTDDRGEPVQGRDRHLQQRDPGGNRRPVRGRDGRRLQRVLVLPRAAQRPDRRGQRSR